VWPAAARRRERGRRMAGLPRCRRRAADVLSGVRRARVRRRL